MIGKKDDQNKKKYCAVLQHSDILAEVNTRLCRGNEKYGVDNWKQLPPIRLKEALVRHMIAYLNGEIIDSECPDKTTHFSAIISNCMMLDFHEKKASAIRYERSAEGSDPD